MVNAPMTANEKLADLTSKWMSPPGVEFASPEAEKAYKERVQRFLDAINMKVPDRVPVFPMTGFFPAYYAGYTPYDVMYDYEKLVNSGKKYVLEMEPDGHGGVIVAPSCSRVFSTSNSESSSTTFPSDRR